MGRREDVRCWGVARGVKATGAYDMVGMALLLLLLLADEKEETELLAVEYESKSQRLSSSLDEEEEEEEDESEVGEAGAGAGGTAILPQWKFGRGGMAVLLSLALLGVHQRKKESESERKDEIDSLSRRGEQRETEREETHQGNS